MYVLSLQQGSFFGPSYIIKKRFHEERNRSRGRNACNNQKLVVPLQRI